MARRIVVVEDEGQVLLMLQRLLGKAGYHVITVQDSRQAYAKIQLVKPDLVILDVMMPHVDGLSLCHMIRQSPELKGIRIAILSAKVYEADKLRAFQLGADIFIEKPFHPHELLARVTTLLMGKIKVRFWGTRGSVPTPGINTTKYGGNTPCVEVRLPDNNLLVFDAGTGIRNLGNMLSRDGKKVKASIFISHPHWDHIQGLPFFLPAYGPRNELVIYGAEQPDMRLDELISAQMESLFFPITLKELAADITFKRLSEGSCPLPSLDAVVDTIFANHPGFTLSYRLSCGSTKLAYMTDNELDSVAGSQWLKFVEFVKGAKLLIHDAQYSKEEYATHKGWGHSSWPKVLDLALAGKVEQLALFHHDPDHTDADIDLILEACQTIVREQGAELECFAAQEGMEIIL